MGQKDFLLWHELAVKQLGGKCEVCGETENLEIHHKDSNHQNNSPENLQLLCHLHHRQAPHIRRARGVIISGNRITLAKNIVDDLCLKINDPWEMETFTKDPDHPKIIVTFFKVGTR